MRVKSSNVPIYISRTLSIYFLCFTIQDTRWTPSHYNTIFLQGRGRILNSHNLYFFPYFLSLPASLSPSLLLSSPSSPVRLFFLLGASVCSCAPCSHSLTLKTPHYVHQVSGDSCSACRRAKNPGEKNEENEIWRVEVPAARRASRQLVLGSLEMCYVDNTGSLSSCYLAVFLSLPLCVCVCLFLYLSTHKKSVYCYLMHLLWPSPQLQGRQRLPCVSRVATGPDRRFCSYFFFFWGFVHPRALFRHKSLSSVHRLSQESRET